MRGFIKKIEQINFGLLSPEDIRAMSSVTVETPDTYEDDGFPIEKGLMDPRMGVVDPSLVCTTCGFRGGDCQGHFGSIELARPVIHIGFGDVIHKILRSTCNECGRVLLNDEQIEYFTEKINEAIHNRESLNTILKDVYRVAKKEKRHSNFDYGYERDESNYFCPHCGAPQEAISLNNPVTIRQGDYKLTPSEVRERLEKITDKDAFVLGVNPEVARPEWLVLTVLPVPPVTVRPSITLDTGERSEDDLTHKLVDILRINQRLLENMEAGAPQLIVEDLWELLQYHVTTYFDNEASGVPPARHRSGRPLKTLIQRLKGREGRFRSNLSGKRVNFSARTVISPDPNISINEVGVPEMIAKEVTVPVYVNEWNIEEIKKYIINGPYTHPGANYIIRTDGRKIRVRTDESIELILEQLEPGFIIERHLKDGDMVLFNRQPSLHRMSMMAHEVRVLPYKTFRINPCVCPPYNADFDGDEMNLHVFQTDESRAEGKYLLSVQEHILSPRFGGPIMGAIHDHITGAYLLTRDGVEFTEEQALQIIRKSHLKLPELRGDEWFLKTDLDLKPGIQIQGDIEDSYIIKEKGAIWTGKELFSLLLPNDLNLSYSAEISKCPVVYPAEDASVVIKNGKLVQGVIDESAYGSFSGKILDKIVKEYGPGRAKEFLDRSTDLAICGIMKTGITTSLNDEEIPEEAQDRINEHLEKKMAEVDKLVESYEEGYLQALPGRSLEETLEMKIMQVLGEARDMSGSIAENYLTMGKQYDEDPYDHVMAVENHSVVMARTGARASMLNLTQITACVGQQAVRGGRIERGYLNRTLPHFKKGELGAKAKGFVHSSYKSGLDPIEFFFHAMGGREGLVDTAIRTAQSGYMQRRLVNALQDLQVKPSGLVTDNQGNVIQTMFGEDGVDPAKSDFGKPADLNKLIDEIRIDFLATDEHSLQKIKFKSDKFNEYDEQEFIEEVGGINNFEVYLDDETISQKIDEYNELYFKIWKDFDENRNLLNQENNDESYNLKRIIFQLIKDISLQRNQKKAILYHFNELYYNNYKELDSSYTIDAPNEKNIFLDSLSELHKKIVRNQKIIDECNNDLLNIKNLFNHLDSYNLGDSFFQEEHINLICLINDLQIKVYQNMATLYDLELRLESEVCKYENLIEVLKNNQKIIKNHVKSYTKVILQVEESISIQNDKFSSIENDIMELYGDLQNLGLDLLINFRNQKDEIIYALEILQKNMEDYKNFEKNLNEDFLKAYDKLNIIKKHLKKSNESELVFQFQFYIEKIKNDILKNDDKLNQLYEDFNLQKSNYNNLITSLNNQKEDKTLSESNDKLYMQLIRYNELLQSGIITQDEFDELKRKLIFGDLNDDSKEESNEFLIEFKKFIEGPFYSFVRNSVNISDNDANTILKDIESKIIVGTIKGGNIKEIIKSRFEEKNQIEYEETLRNKFLDFVNSNKYNELSNQFNDLSSDEKNDCISNLQNCFDSNFKEEDIESTLKIIYENKRKEKYDLTLLKKSKSNLMNYMVKYNLFENEVISIFDDVQYDIIESNLADKDFNEYIEWKFQNKVNENKKDARFELNLFLNKRSKIKDLTGLNDNQIDLLSDDLTFLISKNKLRKEEITEELFVEKSIKFKIM